MNFKKIFYLSAIAALMGSAASCSSEDVVVDNATSAPEGKGVQVSITACIGGEAASRAEIHENNGALKSYWDEGDVIYGYDQATGAYIGELVAHNPDETGYATFTGTLFVYEHTILNFYYLGNEPDRSFNEFVVNLEHQDASYEGLSDYTYLCATDVTFDIQNGNGYLNKETGKPLMFNFFLSYVHFDLQFPASAGYDGEDIVISGANLRNLAYLVLGNNTLDVEEEEATITVNRVNDIYLAIIPNTDIEFNFYTKVGEEEYIATYGSPKTMEPAIYYRRQLANGQCVGVPIVFSMVEPDLSNNPLFKWAESNLTGDYSGGNPYNNVFAENATDAGYLYQWGRNHGFADADDAIGPLNNEYIYYPSIGTYYFTRPYGYSQNTNGTLTLAHSGMPNSMHIKYISGYGQRAFDENPVVYTSVDELRMWPEWFLMANYDLYGQYNYDYWTFAGGGSTWYERADLCGYPVTNPCPEGWRLPTTAEFEEIMPTTPIDAGRKSMASQLNGTVELRTSLKGERYAIRWLNYATSPAYMKIQAVVVSKTFDESQLSSINWEGREVVTRIFPYGGLIEGAYYMKGSNYNGYDFIARPMPRCTVTSKFVDSGLGWYGELGHYELSVNQDFNRAYGSYWTGDSKNVMRMQDYGIIANNNITTYFELAEGTAQDARAIRCVMDDTETDYTGHHAVAARTSVAPVQATARAPRATLGLTPSRSK